MASRSSSPARTVRTSAIHELGEQPMEVVHATLAGRRVAAAVVEPRPHAALYGFDDRLVLALDAIEARAGALAARGVVPDEREERHPGAIHGERRHDVHRHAPRENVEHLRR